MALIFTAFLIWVYMTLWYFVSIVVKRHDIADTAWGLGFIFVAGFNLIFHPHANLTISLILVTLWGLRLALHIYQRNKNKKEDYRYQQFKSNPYFKVFIVQGFFMWLISLPLMASTQSLSWFNYSGILIWLIGFYFEATADRQLKEFIKNPLNRGKIMQSGLWAYSRHPNYFGEVVLWWGIWLLNFGGPWWTILGPLTITFLITRVSGIPMLEQKYAANPEFQAYSRRVSVFIPWKPKKF